MNKQCLRCQVPLRPAEEQSICARCMLQGGLPPEHQGAAFECPSLAELGQRFPQLEILELIGQGGMGAVYRARQPRLDRMVALKILRPRAASQAEFTGRFVQEAQVLAKLSHPNIVGVYDFGVEQDLHWLMLEYVDGSNLREVLSAGALPPKDCFGLIPHICEALQYAHDQGVVHRDIKPENILLDLRGRIRIADFGLARLIDTDGQSARLTRTHEVFGTPLYMAPEQITGARDVDHRADIYALGAVFYELLTGETPLGRFEPPSTFSSAVDARVDELVLRALAKEPASRYQQASDVQDALGKLQSKQSEQPQGEQVERRRGQDLLGLVACCTCLVLAFVTVLFTEQPFPLGLFLFLPGCGLGASIVRANHERSAIGIGLFLLIVSVAIAIFGALIHDSIVPFISLGFFACGVGAGHHAEEQRLEVA